MCCVLQDAEKRRIVDAGCKVFSGRVNGDLAVWLCVCVWMGGAVCLSTDKPDHLLHGTTQVSRALGDFGFKMQPNVAPELQPVWHWACIRWHQHTDPMSPLVWTPQVSPMPEVTALQREAAHEFAVLACDGVWDVMSSSHVVDLVRASVLDGEQDLGKVCLSV